jgi:hypothetical protein
MEQDGVERTDVLLDMDKWQTFLYIVMDFQFP